jgi:organic radical activating enzyme
MQETSSPALSLMEHFYTLQGEGRYSGQASYFIRLGGCDVGCTWCDVKESWDATKHPQVTIEYIVNVVRVSGSPIAVITGGEPLMHNLSGLTAQLKSIGVRTHIETSGAHPLSGSWDWICLSPKKFKAPREEVIKRANELKVVVYNKSDFEWAEKYAALVSPDCLLYLQPEWSKASVMNSLIVSYIKENPKWIFSSQSHKFLDIP